MARSIYDVGDEVLLGVTFEDPVTEEAVTPEEVLCTVRAGDHRILEPEVEEEGEGFKATIDIDVSGFWAYRFAGTGGYKAAGERTFEVRDSKVSP